MIDVGSDGEPQKSWNWLPLGVGDQSDSSQWAVSLQIREPREDPLACQLTPQTPSLLPSPLFFLPSLSQFGHLLAVWSWVNSLSYFYPNFLIPKMGELLLEVFWGLKKRMHLSQHLAHNKPAGGNSLSGSSSVSPFLPLTSAWLWYMIEDTLHRRGWG